MISVIIPTYNEKKISLALEHLKLTGKRYEVIVVDSSPLKLSLSCKVVKSLKGRAKQMNKGAKFAKGKWLLFLHADSFLPLGWSSDIEESNADGGAFLKKFDKKSFLLYLNAAYGNLRALIFKHFLGDNAIFVKKSVFLELGGYKDIALMEDVEFSKRLRKYKLKVIKKRLVTSARRFEKYGILRTLLLIQKIRILYWFGVDPGKLKEMYR